MVLLLTIVLLVNLVQGELERVKQDLNANGGGGDLLLVLDGHVDVHDGDPRI